MLEVAGAYSPPFPTFNDEKDREVIRDIEANPGDCGGGI
jgi:hypothetical protein